MVIVVFGLPGSGKSYFATRLAAAMNAKYVSTDELRLSLFPIRTYSDAEKESVYHEMLNIMKGCILEKKPVVLDGTFYKESLRIKFEEALKELHEKPIYIEVTATEEIIEERLKKPRVNSEADINVYRKLKASAEPFLEDHLILDSSNDTIETMLHKAIHYIDSRR